MRLKVGVGSGYNGLSGAGSRQWRRICPYNQCDTYSKTLELNKINFTTKKKLLAKDYKQVGWETCKALITAFKNNKSSPSD